MALPAEEIRLNELEDRIEELEAAIDRLKAVAVALDDKVDGGPACCPLCNGERVAFATGGIPLPYADVYCQDCGLRIQSDTLEEAREHWNMLSAMSADSDRRAEADGWKLAEVREANAEEREVRRLKDKVAALEVDLSNESKTAAHLRSRNSELRDKHLNQFKALAEALGVSANTYDTLLAAARRTTSEANKLAEELEDRDKNLSTIHGLLADHFGIEGWANWEELLRELHGIIQRLNESPKSKAQRIAEQAATNGDFSTAAHIYLELAKL